jgi:2-C-methyl-D-erythritol 4-phosphate cytidylyltransferase
MPSPELVVAAIVVAGGSGTRFGGLKQFAELEGVTVAARSIAACRSVAPTVVLVAPVGTEERYGADQVVAGGASRAASVRAGLAALDGDVDVVVVHDAARPLASERLFFSVVGELADERVDGAICAVGVTDTIKRVIEVDGRRRVDATLERSELVAVQTPQAFRADALRKAHASGAEATDDAALVEALGGVVVVVSGDDENLKLTSPIDLAAAAEILGQR